MLKEHPQSPGHYCWQCEKGTWLAASEVPWRGWADWALIRDHVSWPGHSSLGTWWLFEMTGHKNTSPSHDHYNCNLCFQDTESHTETCTQAHTYICTHTCTHAVTPTYTHALKYIQASAYMYVLAHMQLQLTYMLHTYTHMRTNTHTCTHAQIWSSPCCVQSSPQ